jgi:hypothetical protein
MLGVNNNREPIKGKHYRVLKNEIDEEKSNDETLTINTTLEFDEPLKYAEVTIEKHEDMSDEQFMIFVKNLQKEIENYDVHEGELTS